MPRLTSDERAERALWLCEAMTGLDEHNATTKEMVKERRIEAEALKTRIAKLKREVETGESDPVQLELEEGGR